MDVDSQRVIQWPDGPWSDEPNRVEWVTAAGYPAIVLRGEWHGALCGYVAIPRSHPYAKRERLAELVVHGGVTYGPEPCNRAIGICHTPGAGETDDVVWIGFDACHVRDLVPIHLALHGAAGAHGTYRDVWYMRAQCESLASQLRGRGTC